MGAISKQLWTCSTPAHDVVEPAAVTDHPVETTPDSSGCDHDHIISRNSNSADICIRCVTFNVNASPPPSAAALQMLLGLDRGTCDMIMVCTQESGPEVQQWQSRLQQVADPDWHSAASDVLLGILVIVLTHSRLRQRLSRIQTCRIAIGVGGVMGNKGAVAVQMTIDRSIRVLLVGCHLAANADQVAARNTGFHRIVSGLFHNKQAISPRPSLDAASMSSASGSESPPQRPASPSQDALAAYDLVIWLGDLNYRVDLDAGATAAAIDRGDLAALLAADQLRHERAAGNAFQGFQEGRICFRPTFKLQPHSTAYNETRTPSFTDRILWRQPAKPQMQQQNAISCELTAYESIPFVDSSDHRPVTAMFRLRIGDRQPAPAPES